MKNKGTKNITVIVKVTHDCNLGCLYCLTPPEAERGAMDNETLENMIRKVAGYTTESTCFIWHGGEPLLAGLAFFKEIVRIQKSLPEHRFINDVQTNATLVGPYLDFFEEHNFRVGVSLDGPRQVHDLTRPYSSGESSFNDTFEVIKELKRRRLGGGVISILNKVRFCLKVRKN